MRGTKKIDLPCTILGKPLRGKMFSDERRNKPRKQEMWLRKTDGTQKRREGDLQDVDKGRFWNDTETGMLTLSSPCPLPSPLFSVMKLLNDVLHQNKMQMKKEEANRPRT